MGVLMFLLGVLKIIGIILLIVLLLILFLLTIVVFTPIKYKIKVEKIDKLMGRVRVTYLFGLVKIILKYDNNVLKYKIKIFIKRYNKSLDLKSEDIKASKAKKTTQDIKPKKYKEKVKKNVKKETKKDIKNEIKKTKKEAKEINLMKKFNTIRNLPYWDEIFENIKMFLKKILKHLLPRKLSVEGKIGRADPSRTGYIFGFLGIINGFLGKSINMNIKGNFEEEVLKGKLYAEGKIRICYLLYISIILVLKKSTRRFIKLIKTEF